MDGFSRIPVLRLTILPQEIEHAHYKYYVFVEPEALKSDWSRDRIMIALMAVAQRLGETSLMFMVHPTFSVNDMEDVVRQWIKSWASPSADGNDAYQEITLSYRLGKKFSDQFPGQGF